MKRITKYIFILLAFISINSCKKFLDVNTNPNSPTTAPINGLLIRTTQNVALNVYRVGNITSYYVQYLASPNPDGPTDTYDKIDASSTWTSLYDNMTDIYDLEKMAKDAGATQYQGVAKILMAMDLHLVHNLWGSAPYSEAFTLSTLTPKYDDATALFQTCLTLLDEGIALLNTAGSKIVIPTSGTSPDLIHKGVTAAWIRTAHALKARLLNQLSKTPQYNTANIFTELAAAYTAPGQDAAVTTFSVRNPWAQAAVNNAAQSLDVWLSQHWVNQMRDTPTFANPDPRLPLIASKTKAAFQAAGYPYLGTRNGKGRVGTGTTQDESYLSTTGFYSSTASPLYIITYEEMKFIEAEAAFRSGDKTRAYNAYLEGIKANLNKLGVTATDRDKYVNHASVSVGSAALTLTNIFQEKWKALFLTPVSWDDARRFNYAYPLFQLPLNVKTSTFVRRLVYPSVEISRNGAKVPAVTDVTQRLWWDL
jgi:hypothetical protein